MPQSEMIEVADIVGTHGLRGDLKVRLRSGDSAVLQDVDTVVLRHGSSQDITVEIMRRAPHKGQLLMRFRGYENIALAQPLVGGVLLVAADALPQLGGDEFYWGELQGLAVIDRRVGHLGKLVRIFTTAAHDVYVVEGNCGEVLIPAVKQFVLAVTPEKGEIHVDLPDGLIPDDA